MNKLPLWLSLLVLPACTMSAEAQGIFGIFGSKKPKGNPVQRVPELIVTLKTAQDERSRVNAASELGLYDGSMFPEIGAVLADVVTNDPRSNVRYEAVSSLGTLRPISQAGGQALDRAASKDENWRVRLHAKNVFLRYRLAGYSPGSAPGSGIKTEEPPLLEFGPVIESQPLIQQPGVVQPGTIQPGVIQQPSSVKDGAVPDFRPARPLPQGFSTAVPQQPKNANPAPLPMVEQGNPAPTPVPMPGVPQGPALAPPPPQPQPVAPPQPVSPPLPKAPF